MEKRISGAVSKRKEDETGLVKRGEGIGTVERKRKKSWEKEECKSVCVCVGGEGGVDVW